jgi:IrrE N-terminal-like domain
LTPQFRCIECGETFFERTDLGLMGRCPECGCDEEGSIVLDLDEGSVPEEAVLIRDPLDEARKAAAALLGEFKVANPPVPICQIARGLGLEVESRFLGGLSGRLEDEVIVVNSDHSRGRQRFTIAHELGHYRLHTSHASGGGDIERQADAFAADLILPPRLVRAEVGGGAEFDALRGRFDVSRQALKIALERMRLTGSVSGIPA